MAGDGERRRIDTRCAEPEPARIDIGGAVAARAIAVERPDRDVVARESGDRNRVAGRRSGEGSGARSVAGETAAHALVDPGDRVDRVVAGGGVALGTGR